MIGRPGKPAVRSGCVSSNVRRLKSLLGGRSRALHPTGCHTCRTSTTRRSNGALSNPGSSRTCRCLHLGCDRGFSGSPLSRPRPSRSCTVHVLCTGGGVNEQPSYRAARMAHELSVWCAELCAAQQPSPAVQQVGEARATPNPSLNTRHREAGRLGRAAAREHHRPRGQGVLPRGFR